ncbi:MAG: Ig-like domain-containing protein [Thermoanaerobaculia bacterium]|nr:Ig-like domain-containing protein [Thermoanaerobaculia bacterium]
MRKMIQGITGLVIGSVLCALPAYAGVTGIDREVIVDPRKVSVVSGKVVVEIPPASLLGDSHPAGSTIVSNTGVLHGTLEPKPAGVLEYSPDDEFWLHGTDRFTFTVQHPGGNTQIGVAMLVAQTPGYFDSAVNFDGPLGVWAIEELQGTATAANSKLTILGTAGGLQLAEANVNRDQIPDGEAHGLSQGGKVIGGGGSPPPQPPPPPPSGLAVGPDYYESFTLLRGVATFDGKPFSLTLRPRPEGDDLRVDTISPSGSVVSSDWAFIGLGPHRYEVMWWENAELPTVMVWVDGRLVVTKQIEELNIDRIELGVLSPHTVTGSGLQLDDITLHGWDYGAPTKRARLAVVESFEDGVANDLSTSGTAYMSTSGPMNGTRDLVVESWSGLTSSVIYQNANNQAERSWGARFRLRADNLVLPENALVTIAEAYSNARGNAPFRVELRRNSGNVYQLRTVVKLNNGTEQASAWGHFNPAGTNVEVQYTTPPSGTFQTGTARLWVSGVLRSEQTLLDNYNLTTDGFRMGLINPASGISGYARFDTIQTWALTN